MTDAQPVRFDELIEPELAAIAALESKRRGGTAVALDELDESTPGYPGAPFAQGYRLAKYPEGTS